MIKSFDATLTGKILWILAAASLALLLGISMFAPMAEEFSGLNPVGSAWAGPNCDADGDGYVKNHRNCPGTVDCDDTIYDPTNSCSSDSGAGTVFFVDFTGPVYGSAYSNPTEDKGNIQNLVFNKVESEVDFNLAEGVFGTCLAPGKYGATMHLLEGYLDGLGSDPGLVARFWFKASGISYVLELFDTEFETPPGPDWSGDFPPFAGGEIYRTAESWEIRTTKKNVNGACTGAGDFVGDGVDFVLGPDARQ